MIYCEAFLLLKLIIKAFYSYKKRVVVIDSYTESSWTCFVQISLIMVLMSVIICLDPLEKA